MTIEECNAAAYRRCEVISDGIVYKRIARISRVFSSEEQISRGKQKTYYVVVLEDKNGNSYTECFPQSVQLTDKGAKSIEKAVTEENR